MIENAKKYFTILNKYIASRKLDDIGIMNVSASLKDEIKQKIPKSLCNFILQEESPIKSQFNDRSFFTALKNGNEASCVTNI